MKKILSLVLAAALILSIGLISSNANAQGKKVEFPIYVYSDHLARGNHYCASGWMGDYGAIRVKSAWKENPHSGKTCMQWTYTGEPTQGAGWAGVFWQNPPNNWGKVPGGYDLTGATRLTFWARGEKGGEIVEFKAGGIMGDYGDSTDVTTDPVSLSKEWKQYTIDLTGEDLSYISGGFCWVVSGLNVPEGGIIFYLDDIVYEKVAVEIEEEKVEEEVIEEEKIEEEKVVVVEEEVKEIIEEKFRKIELVQLKNKHWQLKVDGKPYVIKGMAYTPNKVGLSPDDKTLEVHKDWMLADFDKNGKIDGPYDAWVDKNRDDRKNLDEKAVGDFALMRDMGVNTIRLYHHAYNKELLREGYEKYGFMYLMGDYLGMYAIGSGAEWYEGTDYTNPEHCNNMMKSVKKMVMEYKDEPYILMWVLGNENNYAEIGILGVTSGLACKGRSQLKEYYKFVNRVAGWIKSVDPERPIAICNWQLLGLDIFAKYCPDIDVYGCNNYRGQLGFGKNFWEDIKEFCNKPVLITEYGCPAYCEGVKLEKGEELQAECLKNNWRDIESNLASSGIGNALGGVLFEWTDEWWKAGPPPKFSPSEHESWGWDPNTKKRLPGNFNAPFPDNWMHEEWLGICSQGDGSKSPFLRQLRPVYFVYQKMWK